MVSRAQHVPWYGLWTLCVSEISNSIRKFHFASRRITRHDVTDAARRDPCAGCRSSRPVRIGRVTMSSNVDLSSAVHALTHARSPVEPAERADNNSWLLLASVGCAAAGTFLMSFAMPAQHAKIIASLASALLVCCLVLVVAQSNWAGYWHLAVRFVTIFGPTVSAVEQRYNSHEDLYEIFTQNDVTILRIAIQLGLASAWAYRPLQNRQHELFVLLLAVAANLALCAAVIQAAPQEFATTRGAADVLATLVLPFVAPYLAITAHVSRANLAHDAASDRLKKKSHELDTAHRELRGLRALTAQLEEARCNALRSTYANAVRREREE